MSEEKRNPSGFTFVLVFILTWCSMSASCALERIATAIENHWK